MITALAVPPYPFLMILLGYILAALVGLSLGLIGGGGSILTVPIFVYVVGLDPKLAIAISLPVVGTASLVGAIGHWRAGNVDLRMAALFGAIAMLGAYGGSRLAVFLTGSAQLALLAVVMLAASASMFRSARRSRIAPTLAEGSGAGAHRMALSALFPVALGVGLLTGVAGIGGGFLVVPALVVLGRVAMKQAIGTSLLVIAMNSAAGFAGYIGRVDIPWGFVISFTAVAIGGILVGTQLVRFVSAAALKQAFAVFVLVMGGFILFRNRAVFLPARAPVAAPSAGARP